jgi:hypothetical protein
MEGFFRELQSWWRMVSDFRFVSQLIAITCVFGYWTMRKWAVWVYSSFFIISQLGIVVAGYWTPTAALGPGCFIAVGLYYYRRMR